MSKKMVDYYDILGVSATANERTIRKAYGEKLKEFKSLKKSKSNVDLDLLARAYRTLIDEDDRELYDRKLDYYYYEKEQEELQNATIVEETFMEEVKRSYDEVKQDEKKLKGRHKKLNKEFTETYGENQNMVLKTKLGVLHIVGETIYQVDKLTHAKKDGPVKFVVRNRKMIGIILAAGMLVGGVNVAKVLKERGKESSTNDTSYTTTTESKEYKFHKAYKVQRGDTLEELCEETGLSEYDFKLYNDELEDTRLLKEDHIIIIPFSIKTSDLEEYTKIVDTGDLSVRELAEEYETDIVTLEDLNNNSFDYNYETKRYEPTTDQIIVPAFDEVLINNQIVSKHY